MQPATWQYGSLGTCLEIGQHALDCLWTRIAPVTQIEHKPRISNDISTKTGWSSVITAQEFLYFSKQTHRMFSL